MVQYIVYVVDTLELFRFSCHQFVKKLMHFYSNADLDECANKTSGCQQLCKNIPGGYECHCKPGYALFTSDGAEGFRLANNEDGLRKEDERVLNHTCVRE